MLWVLLFAGIFLGGIVMLVMYAIWLWHKLTDLWSEVKMLMERGEEFSELVGQIEFGRTVS